jgi:hypothetical protein
MHAQRTRFIPDALLGRFELRSHRLAPPWQLPAAGRPDLAPVDLGARMRAMWR